MGNGQDVLMIIFTMAKFIKDSKKFYSSSYLAVVTWRWRWSLGGKTAKYRHLEVKLPSAYCFSVSVVV